MTHKTISVENEMYFGRALSRAVKEARAWRKELGPDAAVTVEFVGFQGTIGNKDGFVGSFKFLLKSSS
jgi:hypothetical protein